MDTNAKVSRPEDKDDHDAWLNYMLAHPSTKTAPNRDLKTIEIAYQLEWFAPGSLHSVRKDLADSMSILKLYSLLQEQPNEKWTLEDMVSWTDKDARAKLTDHIQLNVLVTAGEKMSGHIARIEKARMKMWEILIAKIRDPTFMDFPEDMSRDLQSVVITDRCMTEAEFLDKVPKSLLRKLVAESKPENDFYLNLKKASLCELVANLNTVHRKKMLEKVRKCRSMIKEIGVDKLSLDGEDKVKLQKELEMFETAVESWKKHEAYYLDCQGDDCTDRLKQLSVFARSLEKTADNCSKTIGEAKLRNIKERKARGEDTTLLEKGQAFFSVY